MRNRVTHAAVRCRSPRAQGNEAIVGKGDLPGGRVGGTFGLLVTGAPAGQDTTAGDETAGSGQLAAVADLIRAVGGALLAFGSVVVLLILALAKLDDLAEAARGEAFVAVVGAISTIVGGYVGLKIGATGTDKAVAGQQTAEHGKDAAQHDVAVLMGKLDQDAAEEVRGELKSV
jgi:hypothetical protein